MVLWAWKIIYRKFPCLYELCAIITHDWGYWGLAKMDDNEGRKHPEIMNRWWIRRGYTNFYFNVAREILGHSRFYASKLGCELSPLFRADKLSIALYPRWLYLLLANLSGEIHEYIEIARNNEDGKYIHLPVSVSHQTWWILQLQAHMVMMGLKGIECDKPKPRIIVTSNPTDMECESCGWRGNWQALIVFQQPNREACPVCGSIDSIVELDGVGEVDYMNQERREKIK